MLQICDKRGFPPLSKNAAFAQALAIGADACYNSQMSISLDVIKNLRSRGASIQMQDYLASFLENEIYASGYDSPLFLPTMDFILLLQNQAKSQEIEILGLNIPQVYDPAFFDKISIKATGEMIKGAQIEQHKKDALLAYLDNMDIQRAKHLGLIGEQGQELATGQAVQRRRAQISNSKRNDRGTGKVKSMFESLVSSLNALQVSISNANSAKTKAIQQESLAQQIQQQKANWRDLLVKNTNNAVNGVTGIFKRSKRNSSDISGRKSDRSFIKSMRKAFRIDKNENESGNNSDSQLGRVNAKDIFQQKNAKNAFGTALEHDEEKAKLDTNLVQVIASKAIDATKKDDKAQRSIDSDKPQDNSKLRNADLVAKMQRSSQRMQQQRDAIRQKAEQAHRIDDMSAEKAVKQLQSLGVSMGDSSVAKGNKDLDALAKAQDKQRGS